MRGEAYASIVVAREAAIGALRQDKITSEVVTALARAGPLPVLLKGPTIALWLYKDGAPRTYCDTDLLIAPERWDLSARVLVSLGFSLISEPDPPGRLPHGLMFHRERDEATVDLHRALYGLGASPAEQWGALSSRSVPVTVAGNEVPALAVPARAMHVALHVAQHGPTMRQPLEDLSRALAIVSDEDWDAARRLAVQLDGLAAFAGGLHSDEHGRALMARLAIPAPDSTDVLLRTTTWIPGALHLEWLAQTRGVRPKLRVFARGLVPPAKAMRAKWPLARRGWLGLTACYAWRSAWVPIQALPALATWLQARGRARRAHASAPPQTARQNPPR